MMYSNNNSRRPIDYYLIIHHNQEDNNRFAWVNRWYILKWYDILQRDRGLEECDDEVVVLAAYSIKAAETATQRAICLWMLS